MTPTGSDALANLRDIHLPEAVSFWPPAPGWWLAAALLIASALAVILWRRNRRRSVRRAALRELATIQTGFAENGDVSALALRLSTLLRRTAISRFPRRDVASLHGAEWSRFLARTNTSGRLTPELVGELGVSVYAGPRRAEAGSPSEAWTLAVRDWIRENA
jgi:hypothetical protein